MKPITITIVSAVIFIVIASFNNVHSWPLVAPLVGGIVAMIINKRNNKSYGNLFKSGLSGALVSIVLGVISLLIIAGDSLSNSLEEAGFTFGENSFLPIIVISMILGFLFLITYLIGTAIGAVIPAKNK